MLSLLKTKLAVSALGAALIVGGGAAALAATHSSAGLAGAQPPSAVATSTRPAAAATHAATTHMHVSIEGTLMSATAPTKGMGTITVQERGKAAATQVTINADTRVIGWHAHSAAGLAAAKGHHVQVQAIKQKDGTLLARKITIQGPARGAAQGQQHTQGTGAAATHGQGQSTGKPAQPGASSQHTPSSSMKPASTPASAMPAND